MRLIDHDGKQRGVMSIYEARKTAEDLGYDLVEVAPNSVPPVCRIMDFGKYKYEQSKKSHAQKLHQKGTHLKEVKFRPYTSEHDLEVKLRNVRRFLEEGNKVKITVMFRGREMIYQRESGSALLDKVTQNIGGLGNVDQQPTKEGRNMTMVLSPKPVKT